MLDSRNIEDAQLGDSKLAAMYLGSTLVWPGKPTALEVMSGFALALYGDGTPLFPFRGNDTDTRLAIPQICFRNTAVTQLSWTYCLALLKDGTPIVWGSPTYGEGNVPQSALNAKLVHASGNTCFAVKASDGSVVAWGRGEQGLKNIPAGLVGVEQMIGMPGLFVIARKNDGTVVGWGNNFFGQLNIPPGLNRVTKLFALRNTIVALREEGDLVLWGSLNQGSPQIAGLDTTNLVYMTYSYTRVNVMLVLRLNGDLEYHFSPDRRVTDTQIAVIANGSGYALKFDGTIVTVSDY